MPDADETYFGELFSLADDKDATPASTRAAPFPTQSPQAVSVPRPMSVSALTRRIRMLLEGHFADVWVEGEIGTFKAHTSGHFYFTLKDENSQIPAVMFRGANRRLKFMPENGMLVRVTGSVQIYEPQGKYQIICDTMEPSGIGALQVAFEQLKKKLAAEGLFDNTRKKPLPVFPRTIGVVTSASGAAIRDIINVLFRRFPRCRLVLNPVAVQGESAAQQIARAIDECNYVNRLHREGRRKLPLFDVLIVGRGGGSMEDLWAFNEEVVARAIARSDIPVVSAVGHEIDWTIADFVADVRAPTPSAAAELVVQPRDVWLARITECARRVNSAVEFTVDGYRRRLERAQTHYAFKEPHRLVDSYQQRVDELTTALRVTFSDYITNIHTRVSRAQQVIRSAERIFAQRLARDRQALSWNIRALDKTATQTVSRVRDRLMYLLRQLEAVGPAAVVRRGYTITRSARTREALTSCCAVKPGDAIRTEFQDGHADSTVTDVARRGEME